MSWKTPILGGSLSAAAAAHVNQQVESLHRLNRLHGAGRALASVDSAGRHLDVVPGRGFWAVLDSRVGVVYGWTERLLAANGVFADHPAPRTGTTALNPAYDLNGTVVAAPGTIVWLVPGAWSSAHGQEYLFTNCCVGTGSGSGSDGGLIFTPCCEAGVPTTLYLTITAATGSMSCKVGTVIPLTYTEGGGWGAWISDGVTAAYHVFGCDPGLDDEIVVTRWVVSCLSPGPLWRLYSPADMGVICGHTTQLFGACNPVLQSFSFSVPSDFTCFDVDASGTFDMTLSE